MDLKNLSCSALNNQKTTLNRQLKSNMFNFDLKTDNQSDNLPFIFRPFNSIYNKKNLIIQSFNLGQSEKKILKNHDEKLEARMKILESHNRILDSQLKQLRCLLEGNLNDKSLSLKFSNSISDQANANKCLSIERSSNNIGTLFNNVEDITKAINNLNNLVNAMTNIDS